MSQWEQRGADASGPVDAGSPAGPAGAGAGTGSTAGPQPTGRAALGDVGHAEIVGDTVDRTALAVALLDVAAHGRRARAAEFESLHRAGLAQAALARVAAVAPGGWLLRRAVDVRFGGLATHVRRRKQLIAEHVERFVRTEPRGQVVYLGAGADGAPARLARTHGALDVLALDAAPPAATGARSPNLRVARLDLASTDVGTLAQALGDDRCPATSTPPPSAQPNTQPSTQPRPGSATSAARATLAIAEGLLMYVPRPAVETLLAHLAAAVPGPLTVLGSYLERHRLDDPRSGIARVDRYLRRRGHPSFRWASDRPGLASLLRAADLEPVTELSTGSAYGEELFVARRRGGPAARVD